MPNTWAIDIETIAAPTQSLQELRQKDSEQIIKLIEEDKLRPKGDRKILSNAIVREDLIEKDAEKKLREAGQLIRDKDALNPLTATPICVCVFDMSYAEDILRTQDSMGIKCFLNMDDFYRWANVEVSRFLGFNISNFDIPCLRLHQAKIATGAVERIPALWNEPLDLYCTFGDQYNHSGYSTPHDLRHYVATILDKEAQQVGVVREYLDSDFTGADVAQAYLDNQMDKIIRHCTLDALMAALIATKMRIYR